MNRRLLSTLALVSLVTSCGGVATPPVTTFGAPVVTASATTSPTPVTSEVATTTPSTTTTLSVESLEVGNSLVGQASSEIEIYDLPDGVPGHVLDPTTLLGSPLVFLIETGPVDGWAKVSLPTRPNGSTGWVRAGALDLSVVDQLIVVDLSDRSLRLQKGEATVLETEVAVGSPTNPTPTGRYFVTDVVEMSDPNSAWGPFALGLSAFSDTITEFNGGNGIIGIHGTNRPASIGQPVSLGCVRVPNEIAVQLAELVKLGTPVEIQA